MPLRETTAHLWGLCLLCLVMSLGCGRTDSRVLRLATTTSTRDSGLLEELLPEFEIRHGCRIDVVAVGTGAALKLGEAGEVDVLLVHARQDEEAFMQAGHGIRHEELMYNQFLLLGPASDPASIRRLAPVDALQRIARQRAIFVSRGDDSGTHKREQALWKQAGGFVSWEQYLESGQGMGATLQLADEKQAYILTDQGTYLRFRDKISLVPLAQPSTAMQNPYAVIVVNPDKHELINHQLADDLVEYLIGPAAQERINNFQIGNEPLFTPAHLQPGIQ